MDIEQQLINAYKILDNERKAFKKDKEYGFDFEPYRFFLRVRPLKTQIYGLRVQAYFAYHMDFVITPSSWDCGDFKTKTGHDIEFKCSFIDEDSQSINVKQIRLWQDDLNFYYIFTVDYNDYNNIKYKCYELSKEQMTEECILMNAKPVANVKDKNMSEFSSLGFSIKIGSKHYERWESKYLNRKFDIDKIVNKNLEKLKTEKTNKELIIKQQEYIKHLEEQLRKMENKIKEEKINLKNMLCNTEYKNYKTLFNLQTMCGAIFKTNTIYNRVVSKISGNDLDSYINGTDYNYFLQSNNISAQFTYEEKQAIRNFINEFYRPSEIV